MAKSLLFRLFGVGKIPEQLKIRLENENIQLLEEGLKGSVTYINFKAPGRYSRWKRQLFAGAIILTDERLIALAYSKKIVNIPLDDKRISQLRFELFRKGLVVAFDAGLFQDNWSGTIEYRFQTDNTKEFYDKLKEVQQATTC